MSSGDWRSRPICWYTLHVYYSCTTSTSIVVHYLFFRFYHTYNTLELDVWILVFCVGLHALHALNFGKHNQFVIFFRPRPGRLSKEETATMHCDYSCCQLRCIRPELKIWKKTCAKLYKISFSDSDDFECFWFLLNCRMFYLVTVTMISNQHVDSDSSLNRYANNWRQKKSWN